MTFQRLACVVALLALCAGAATAQLVNGRLTTSFYTFERFDTVGTSRTYVRAFQAIQLSAAQGDFSLNTYLLGAVNGTSEFGDNGRLRFYNLYFRWANIGKVGELSLGRQAVYAGAGNGSIDGLSGRVRLLDNQVTVQAYGGSVVKEEFTGVRSNWHDNLSYGGQVITTALPDARCAVSYMHRQQETDPYWTLRARDTTFTPVPYYITPLPSEEEVGSVDVSYAYGNLATVYGRYDYDFLAKNTMRGQGAVRFNATPALALTGEFIYRKPHVSFNSIFYAFTQNSVTEVEGGAEYSLTPMFRVFGRLAAVSYSDDNSLRWSGGIFCNYLNVNYAGGKGYAGKFQSFNIQGSYPLFDRMVVPTAGVSWASYKLSMDTPRQEALALLAGATVRLVKQFSFDVQGQWMRNKLYNSDMRLQVRLMYWFAERLSIFPGEVKP